MLAHHPPPVAFFMDFVIDVFASAAWYRTRTQAPAGTRTRSTAPVVKPIWTTFVSRLESVDQGCRSDLVPTRDQSTMYEYEYRDAEYEYKYDDVRSYKIGCVRRTHHGRLT